MNHMPADSFRFNGVNSLERWGIKVLAYDVFSPNKRERNRQIPFRHGRYDYGKKYFDERIVTLQCATEEKELTKAEMREVILWLTQRGRLTLWDEQDKYYVGELEESVDVDVLPQEVKRAFSLPFRCEPFAYGEQNNLPIENGINRIDYRGTAETPSLIVIRNPNPFPVTGITLTTVAHKRAQ